MINLREFQPGSYFFHNGNIIQIESYCNGKINVYAGYYGDAPHIHGIDCANIDPIPLTPEWLERCGLPSDKSTIDAGGNYSLVFERREDKLFLVSSSAMESEVIRQIEYVHLFQNIYLDLISKELSINP